MDKAKHGVAYSGEFRQRVINDIQANSGIINAGLLTSWRSVPGASKLTLRMAWGWYIQYIARRNRGLIGEK